MYVTSTKFSADSGRNRTIATPSKTSSASATPTIRRFDVLLNEQVSLVTNAQDGLRQALELYENASSKEEQESARLQVQSLLSRAEELVLSLQVVIHIRRELTHTQLYALELRRQGEDTTAVFKRLSWLEQRLEKLLFARRRGRPGARGRRTQVSMQWMNHQSQIDDMATIRYPPSTPVDRVSTALPSIAGGDTEEGSDESDFDFSNFSNSPDPAKRHTSDASKSTSRNVSAKQDGSSICSFGLAVEEEKKPKKGFKKHASFSAPESVKEVEDSDTQAQQSDVDRMSGPIDDIIARSTPLPSYMLNFERPRSSCDSLSWNALPLALNSSFHCEEKQNSFQGYTGEDIQSENSVMDVLIEKIELFTSYIEKAAQVFSATDLPLVVPRRLSPEKGSRSISRMKRSAKRFTELSARPASSKTTKLPPLQIPYSDSSTITWSRRKYGKQNTCEVYPSNSTKWCATTSSNRSSLTKQTELKESVRLPSHFRVRHTPATKLKSAKKINTDEEYFESEKHRHQLVQDLVQSLTSPVDDIRKDSAEALGALGASRKEVIKPLEDQMMNDSNYLVQYEAAKALITLGVWSNDLINFIIYSMNCAPLMIQTDLLELLAEVEDFSQLEEFTESYPSCVQVISAVVKDNVSRISFLAALVSSSMNHQYIHYPEAVIGRLQVSLSDMFPPNKSKALCSLVLRWDIKDTYAIEAGLSQMCELSEWKLRLEAITCLWHIGRDHVFQLGETRVFNTLVARLSSDPIQADK
ncbi:uncharacterized protein [Dysidea avara]|uniref:uncharacterized protein isoform X2 n=1 Tax=Dysidea avara TaxID=196820 RepID=UPI00331AF063